MAASNRGVDARTVEIVKELVPRVAQWAKSLEGIATIEKALNSTEQEAQRYWAVRLPGRKKEARRRLR